MKSKRVNKAAEEHGRIDHIIEEWMRYLVTKELMHVFH